MEGHEEDCRNQISRCINALETTYWYQVMCVVRLAERGIPGIRSTSGSMWPSWQDVTSASYDGSSSSGKKSSMLSRRTADDIEAVSARSGSSLYRGG